MSFKFFFTSCKRSVFRHNFVIKQYFDGRYLDLFTAQMGVNSQGVVF